MQRRLIASIAGGIIGICLATRLQDALGVSATLAVIAAAFIGIALGYVASMLFDVFGDTPGPSNE
jgi:uncharacterized membrane protein YuzA (DUF378 family)